MSSITLCYISVCLQHIITSISPLQHNWMSKYIITYSNYSSYMPHQWYDGSHSALNTIHPSPWGLCSYHNWPPYKVGPSSGAWWAHITPPDSTQYTAICHFVSKWAFFYHILFSPVYAPGTIAVNVTSMLVKRLAACTHLSSTVSEI